MFGIRKILFGVVFLAGCGGAAEGGGSKSDGSPIVAAGGQDSKGPKGSGGEGTPTDIPVTDLCASVRIIPDGKCSTDSPLAACDPDCATFPDEGEAGAMNDPCAAIDVAPDGACDPTVACDPDCYGFGTPPQTDICSNIFIIPDGQCDPSSPYVSCDPDCSTDPGAGGAPPVVDDPCAAIDYRPDGKCDPKNACDPDCHLKF